MSRVRIGDVVRVAYNGALSPRVGVVVTIDASENEVRWAKVDFPLEGQESFCAKYLKVVGHVDE